METLGIPMACTHSALHLLSHASETPRRMAQRSSLSGREAQQKRFPVLALQRSRSTSFAVAPPCSPSSSINEQNCALGPSAYCFERSSSERSSLSRLDVELMMKRMVRADKEPNDKDAGEELEKKNDSDYQLWIYRARSVQSSAQIFCSMMFWIALFFIISIMDGETRPRNRRSDRGRHK